MSNKYIRSFMTLEPFEYFNVPKGKVVIEAKNDKCEILIWVQNLVKDKFYDFYLVYRKLSKSYCVFVTSIFTDETGCSQLKYSFKTKDALSHNFNIENFDAVIISSSKKGETTIPLIGFKNDIFKLNKDELVFHKMQSDNKVKPLKDEIKEEIKEEIKQEIKLEKFKPFQKQNRDVKWKRIEDVNCIKNKNLERILIDKFVLNAFNKHGHFLLGYVNDEKGKDYYFAVPDNYSEFNKNKMFKLGFFQFKCIENITPVNNAFGYWLIKTN